MSEIAYSNSHPISTQPQPREALQKIQIEILLFHKKHSITPVDIAVVK